MQLYRRPLLDPPSTWRPTPVSELPSWTGVRRLGLDVETWDPEVGDIGPGIWRTGESRTRVAGIALALNDDGPRYYLPVGHREDNLPADEVWRYMVDQAATFDGEVVGANLGGYDLPVLGVLHGVRFPKASAFLDVLNSAPVIDERHQSYDLEDVLVRAGLPGKNEKHLREAMHAWGLAEKTSSGWNYKKKIALLPARHVAEYGMDDAARPLACLRVHERQIDEQELWDAWRLECEVLPALAQVYERGVRIDAEHLEKVDAWALAEGAAQLALVRRETGVDLGLDGVADRETDLNKKPALLKVLAAIGIREEDLPLTEGGEEAARKKLPLEPKHRKVSADFLATLEHPVAAALSRAKKMDKLRGTFIDGIRRFRDPEGRVHTQYRQTLRQDEDEGRPGGTVTFRFSSKNPNLQNQFSRDDFAAFYKQIFVPEEGALWGEGDFSAQEPRFMVHYGVRAGIPSAIEMARRYRENPDLDTYVIVRDAAEKILGRPLAATPKEGRGVTKTIVLAQAYGQQGAALCRRLGLPTDVEPDWWNPEKMVPCAGPEGKALIESIHGAAPYVRELAEQAKRYAKRHGFVREGVTLGRLRFAWDAEKNRYNFTHKAFNKKVQGGSAKQTKRAFVALVRAGVCVHLQVHDSIGASYGSVEEARAATRIMEECVRLEVPSRVDLKVGASWGAAEKV
jgi:DNA polymerase I-like protein with 3'-5' exonuclease and polymerase domains